MKEIKQKWNSNCCNKNDLTTLVNSKPATLCLSAGHYVWLHMLNMIHIISNAYLVGYLADDPVWYSRAIGQFLREKQLGHFPHREYRQLAFRTVSSYYRNKLAIGSWQLAIGIGNWESFLIEKVSVTLTAAPCSKAIGQLARRHIRGW